MSIKSHLKKNLIAGLFIFVPVFLTLYVIYAFVFWIEDILSPIFSRIISISTGRTYRLPGLGFLVMFLILYVTGIITSNYFGRKFILFFELFFKKIPLVKDIYVAIKDFMEAILKKKGEAFREVVLVEFPVAGKYAIAFVMADTKSLDGNEMVSVFVPTSPNPTSGYILMVQKKDLIHLSVSVEDALKYIISVGTTKLDLEWKKKESSLS